MIPKREVLYKLHYQYMSGISAQKLGSITGVSGDTILSWFRKSGLKTRTITESRSMPLKGKMISNKAKGRPAWNKGLTKETDGRVRNYSIAQKGKKTSDETKRKLSIARTKHEWFNTCQKCSKAKGFNTRKLCVKCAQKIRAQTFTNPMVGKKISESHKLAMRRGYIGKQTRPERKVRKVIEYIFGPYNPYKYNGSGKGIKGLKIRKDKIRFPDFLNEKEKKVIEVFGIYWHTKEQEHETIKDYKEIGYDCLVLWEKDSVNLRDSILYFTYPEEKENEQWD